MEDVKSNATSAHRVDYTKPFNSDNFTKSENTIPAPCPTCDKMGENIMSTSTIPYFKEILMMSFTCAFCGARASETKVGGEITQQGVLITLKVEGPTDLKRELFKSEYAAVKIPEIEFEATYGTLGGIYSSVESLIEKLHDNLKDHNPFTFSTREDVIEAMDRLFNALQICLKGEKPFTLIIQDLIDGSFIQNPFYPEADKNCTKVFFDRNEDQDDFLGIDTMVTENY